MIPILSIVIPTKDRYIYLSNFVTAFAAFESLEIELIIQDNSETQSREFLNFLDQISDTRIKYFYNSGWMSVVENCDLAVEAASGKYVCMLGDDDGMLFDVSLEVVRYCMINSYDAAIVNKAEYYWPDTSHAIWKNLLTGNVFFKNYTFQAQQVLVQDELIKVLKEGATSTLRSLPRVYHGFVEKKSLDRLKSVAGSFFPGPSPDMANAIGLAGTVDRVIEIDIPAVISGHSKRSAGGMGGEKKHHGNIENQLHLPKDTSQLWSDRIPRFWSGATIYAESANEALRRTSSSQLHKLNYTYLIAFCLVFENKYFRQIVPVILKRPFEMPILLAYVLNLCLFRGINFIKNYFKFNNKSKLSLVAKDIFEAQINLNKLLENDFKFSHITE